MGKSVALKCTYNDGHENVNDEGVFVGFGGTCSNENIKRNVLNARVWCSNKECPCRQFHESGMQGEKPVNPCMESELFRKWQFGAGWWHHGEKAETPKHMRQVGAGKFAILTTRFPDTLESERRIIGLFQIEEVLYQDSIHHDTTLTAKKVGRVRLCLEETRELYFWAYHRNRRSERTIPDWRTGLVRYLDDTQGHRILADVATVIQDPAKKAEIQELIAQVFGQAPVPPAMGYLSDKSKW